MNHHKMRFVWKAVNCHHPSFPNYFVNNYSHGGAGAYSMSSTKLTSFFFLVPYLILPSQQTKS